jgi:hypothetical protein
MDDAWVVEACDGSDFVLKGIAEARVPGTRGGDDLHRNMDILSGVDARPDFTHAAYAEQLAELEGANGDGHLLTSQRSVSLWSWPDPASKVLLQPRCDGECGPVSTCRSDNLHAKRHSVCRSTCRHLSHRKFQGVEQAGTGEVEGSEHHATVARSGAGVARVQQNSVGAQGIFESLAKLGQRCEEAATTTDRKPRHCALEQEQDHRRCGVITLAKQEFNRLCPWRDWPAITQHILEASISGGFFHGG